MTRRTFIHGAAALGSAALVGNVASAAEQSAPAVALVGVAHIHTPGFVNTLKERKDIKFKCLWDHEPTRLERRSKEWSIPAIANVNDIWKDPEIKAVVICSETNRHRDLVQDAARAGKHMFVEKPLGISAKDSEDMARAIEKAKVFFTTGYFSRGNPAYRFAKEQIEAGNLGKITRVRGSNCHEGSLGGWFDTDWRWMADPKIAGCGAFGDLGTHLLDILMWLMGDVEAVTADVKVVTGRYGDCDESGEGLIRFKNGVTGTLAAGWVDRADPVPLQVSGTEGNITVVNNQVFFRSNKVQGADGRSPWKQLPPAVPHPMTLFLNAVAGQPNQPLVSPSEAAARVKVMEAMYRGAEKHEWVKI